MFCVLAAQHATCSPMRVLAVLLPLFQSLLGPIVTSSTTYEAMVKNSMHTLMLATEGVLASEGFMAEHSSSMQRRCFLLVVCRIFRCMFFL